MTRARIAARLEVHESTISRAVSRKRAALPSGRIVPLSKFFDRSLSVRDVVRSIIAEENRPLTDTEVAGMLKERGIPVARRTVAKYRDQLGINPARPVREQTPEPLPDRKALDDIVFDILDLTEAERNEVYWAVCELVKNRLEKARSV